MFKFSSRATLLGCLVTFISMNAFAEVTIASLNCRIYQHDQVMLDQSALDLSPDNETSTDRLDRLDGPTGNIWIKQNAHGVFLVNAARNQGILLSEYQGVIRYGKREAVDFLPVYLGNDAFIIDLKSGMLLTSFSTSAPIDSFHLVTQYLEQNERITSTLVAVMTAGPEMYSVRLDAEPKKLSSIELSEKPKHVAVDETGRYVYAELSRNLAHQDEVRVNVINKDETSSFYQLNAKGKLATLREPKQKTISGGQLLSDTRGYTITAKGTQLTLSDHGTEKPSIDFGKPIRYARSLPQGLSSINGTSVIVVVDTPVQYNEEIYLVSFTPGHAPEIKGIVPVNGALQEIRVGLYASPGSDKEDNLGIGVIAYGLDATEKPDVFSYDSRSGFILQGQKPLPRYEKIDVTKKL